MNAHPNEFDRKRIAKRLEDRCRYRYVHPEVFAIENGYEVKSPCCSRNIDSEGGVIDIAKMVHLPQTNSWRLFSKAHEDGSWVYYGEYAALSDLIVELNLDPERKFWQ